MRNEGGTPAKGVLRSYDEACALGVIDRRIRSLVAALNVPEKVSTVSSCEGHRVWALPAMQTPFVMFQAAPIFASQLAARIRRDWLGTARLRNYWTVEGHFNNEGTLLFCLECPVRYYNRRKVDRDFETLSLWVKELLQSAYGSNEGAPAGRRAPAQNGNGESNAK